MATHADPAKAPAAKPGAKPVAKDKLQKLPLAEVEKRLGSSLDGLSEVEAKKRLTQYGPNEIAEKKTNALLKFLGYFWGPIPWMIEIAVVLSGVVRHWPDFFIILVLLIANASIGFWEEREAGNAIDALKARLAIKARVKRDGKWNTAAAKDLVPGDAIRLRLGDIVPADARLLNGDEVSVDQSALTGESLPATRNSGDAIFSGSIIRRGEIDALVYATGGQTYFGKTAELVETAVTVSHFQKAVLKIGDYLIVLALVLVAVFGGGRGIKRSNGQIYETESAYNYIQVLEINGTRYLRLNDGQGWHSEYNPNTLEYGGPWQQFLVGPFFYKDRQPADITRIAIVGLAAGTTARQAAAVFPNVTIDGFEIDPKIVQVGRIYFGLNLPNLNVIIGDGRWGLEKSLQKYDMICVDAYRPPYIPPQLTTREFFQIAVDHLKPDGALAINVGRAPGDRRLINGLATTIGTLFPSIYVMDIPNTFNSILYATLQPTSVKNLQADLAAFLARPGVNPLLTDSMALTWNNLQPAPLHTIVFTDDLSPIEWMTNNLILNFILHGEMNTLK